MAQTKEEIESSIRELQYQYEALIAEGSYKLANQRLKRIKELKEQLKHMNDSMEILRLSGFQVNDACTKDYNFEDPKVIEAVIKKLEKEAKEGKFVDPNYLAGVKRALERAKKERAKDACTKDITVKQYVKKLREESGSPISHESLARELKKAGWSKEEALQEVLREAVERVYGKDACEKVFTKGEAAEDGDIILPQHKCSDDDATENGSIEEFGKNREIEKMSPEKDPTLADDGGPGSGIKGHSTIEKLENRQDYLENQIRKLKNRGDRYSRQMLKGFMEEYEAITRRLSNTKDSDPKVAEANAIINLCGGVM